MSETVFTLAPRAPYRLDLTVWALRRRPDNAVDRWDGRIYRRVLVLAGRPVAVAVVQDGPLESPELQVTATGAGVGPDLQPDVTAVLERLLGLDRDLDAFYQFAASDPRLGPLAARFRGFKPPRYSTLFETLLNAIACQQVTLTLGIRLLNHLAERYGPAAASGEAAAHALPLPDDLEDLDPEELRRLAFSRQKARAMVEAAGTIAAGRLTREDLEGLDDAAAAARLCQLRGVGRWTAEYVLLRGLGRLHVFPGDDVGAVNNLRRWLGRTEALSYDGVRQILARWQPYGGLLYLHLLLDRLAGAGYLDEGEI